MTDLNNREIHVDRRRVVIQRVLKTFKDAVNAMSIQELQNDSIFHTPKILPHIENGPDILLITPLADLAHRFNGWDTQVEFYYLDRAQKLDQFFRVQSLWKIKSMLFLGDSKMYADSRIAVAGYAQCDDWFCENGSLHSSDRFLTVSRRVTVLDYEFAPRRIDAITSRITRKYVNDGVNACHVFITFDDRPMAIKHSQEYYEQRLKEGTLLSESMEAASENDKNQPWMGHYRIEKHSPVYHIDFSTSPERIQKCKWQEI